MEALVDYSRKVRLRRIDIKHWRSGVARQYSIRRLPTLWLYDGYERISEDRAEIMKLLEQ